MIKRGHQGRKDKKKKIKEETIQVGQSLVHLTFLLHFAYLAIEVIYWYKKDILTKLDQASLIRTD